MAVTRKIKTNISGSVTPTTGQVRISEVIAWQDVPARLGELFGPTTSSGQVATELDDLFGLWRAQSVEFKPLCDQRMQDTVDGASNPDVIMPVFTDAELSITYSTLEQQSPTSQNDADQDGEGDPVPFLTHTWGIGGDFITMDDSSMYWSNGTSAKATGIAANKIIPTIEHSINWKRVVYPPFDAIRECLGKVNSKTMTFSTGKIYPECLLFNGAELSRDIMSDGARAWDLTYRFSERRVDATSIPSALGGIFGSYDGVGPSGDMSDDEVALAEGVVTSINISLGQSTGEMSAVPGIYGGWNHFYRKGPDAGMARLHTKVPATYPAFFRNSTAIYNKYDLLKLFEQDP